MATFLEAKSAIGEDTVAVRIPCCNMTSETYAKSHGQSPLSERWSLPLPGIYYYVLKTKLQTSCRDIVTVAWTLLTAVHAGMLLTHTPMHFFFHCCIQFPTKADSPTGLEGLCHEFYSSSNAEQHWAQHIAVYTTTPHIHNCRAVQKRLPQAIFILSMLACREDLYISWSSTQFIRSTEHVIVMPSSLLQWTLQQHNRPAFWTEQLKTFKLNGQSCGVSK